MFPHEYRCQQATSCSGPTNTRPRPLRGGGSSRTSWRTSFSSARWPPLRRATGAPRQRSALRAPAVRRAAKVRCRAARARPHPTARQVRRASSAGRSCSRLINCDDLLPGEAANTSKFKQAQHPRLARIEGPPDFNLDLSCHRANQVAKLARATRPDCRVAGVSSTAPLPSRSRARCPTPTRAPSGAGPARGHPVDQLRVCTCPTRSRARRSARPFRARRGASPRISARSATSRRRPPSSTPSDSAHRETFFAGFGPLVTDRRVAARRCQICG